VDTSSIRPQLVQNKAICVGLRTSTHMLPRIIDMNGCKWQKKKMITFDYTIGDRQPFLFLRLTKNIYIFFFLFFKLVKTLINYIY
jgi:hypothetical protein